MADELVQLECTVGEDAAWQIFWVDEYGDPVPITEPVLADVKDATGQIAIRFSTNADPATQAKITLSAATGFIQLTAPAEVTRTLVPGKYLFDLFGSVADSAPPFDRQLKQIVKGYLAAGQRVTKIEQAPEALTSETPSGI